MSDLELIASLQRELAEARAKLESVRAEIKEFFCHPVCCSDKLEAFCYHRAACDKLIESLSAPGPSDAKGEGEAPSDLVWGPSPRRNRQMILELAELTGADAAVSKLINDRIADKSRTDTINVNSELYHAEIVKAITALKSRPSLTPLTDESVRGVLVDDGEPTNYPPVRSFFIHPERGLMMSIAGRTEAVVQPVRLRPASEFGVPAKPSAEVRFEANEGVPSLERVQLAIDTLGYYGHFQQGQDGWAALCVLRAHLAALKSTPAEPVQKLVPLPEGVLVYRQFKPGDAYLPSVELPLRVGRWINCDPALYGVPAERVECMACGRGMDRGGICGECKGDELQLAHYVKEAERLRKAIERALPTLLPIAIARGILEAALTPPTAASGEPAMECLDKIGEAMTASAPTAEGGGDGD